MLITDEHGNTLFNDTVTTNGSGCVDVPFVPITNGSVTIVADFDGNPSENVYIGNSSTKSPLSVADIETNMTVSVENTTINDTTSVVVNVSDVNGMPVANGTIKFVFSDGTVVDDIVVGPDNEDITFSVDFDNTHVGKDVTVNVTFVPNDNSGYAKCSVDDTEFNVAKLNTTVEIDTGSPVAHNETIATITLKNSTANVPNEPINITIVDKEGNVLFNDTVKTTEEGIIEVPYTPVTGSPINITAVFDGNPEENVYIGSDNSIEVTPAMMETTLVLNSTNTIVDGTSTIGVNVT
ncbi:hypothetical protein, partial [Methanosphaera sp.]